MGITCLTAAAVAEGDLAESNFGYKRDRRREFAELEKEAAFGVFYREPVELGPKKSPNPLLAKSPLVKFVEQRNTKKKGEPIWKDPTDGSRDTLPENELEERRRDNKRRTNLPKPSWRELATIEDLLNDRALPCVLNAKRPSRRSVDKSPRQRAYPERISAWNDHTSLVIGYQPKGPLRKAVSSVYRSCWESELSPHDEENERGYLKNEVLKGLSRVMKFGCTVAGNSDDCVIVRATNEFEEEAETEDDEGGGGEDEEGRPVVIIEEKSTHNLRLLEKADDIVQAYKDLDWRTTHPLGQLAREMLVNECGYGVLTSGTRTYFVRAMIVNGKVEFFVSRRWYVAEPHYLRAWAWMIDVSKVEGPVELRCGGKGWRGGKFRAGDVTESPTPKAEESSPTKKRISMKKHAGGPVAADTPNDEPWEGPNRLGVLEVPENDLQIHWGRVLGRGRNGAVVEARWSGRTVALKQFDLDHGGGPHFQRELETYVALRRLQGKAVARLLFVSRSWCGMLRFMGIEKGVAVKGDEADLEDEMDRVHDTLLEAGWRQDREENELKNYVWQVDARLVAIDLELFEHLQEPLEKRKRVDDVPLVDDDDDDETPNDDDDKDLGLTDGEDTKDDEAIDEREDSRRPIFSSSSDADEDEDEDELVVADHNNASLPVDGRRR